GVSVDLVVRSICTIKPGVKGLSENINVYSIVDRYLEHSRMFYFRNGEKEEAEGMMYIGSADLMYRNLTNRVEVLTPIEDKDAKREFLKIMNIYLESDNQTWKMNPNGTFTRFNNKVTPSQKVLNQFYVKQNS
ncbi:MAG: polyphosphate kinase 1, partial [Bdellovibrionales bacterium]|nr:polyphosphate kinase 1 [Bdellovibrionales bacterium]